MKFVRTAVVTLALAATPATALAQQPPTENTQPATDPTATTSSAPGSTDPQAEMVERLRAFDASLRYQTGEVSIGNSLARVNLGADFRYLDPAQTDRVLQLWGNPPNTNTLGLIVPVGVSPVQDDAWAVVLTSVEDGHVNDDDANDINFDEVLEEMKRDSRTASERRVQMGLSPLTLVGWAERPHYDRATHILYWARDLEGSPGEHTLNYAVRVLGRTHVLELNAVASMGQLPMMRGRMESLRQRVTFEQGRRYSDFVPSTDRVAAYGIGALIAGKVIAKTGILKMLIAALVAGKKLVLAGFAALAAGVRSLLGKKSSQDDNASGSG